ncbi:corticosteroid-binding globulin [Oryctolagus cuniculus]|uniref:corticosteroid-binding globulin n=1 Tax=Oryctolagus cuniculus TaxID=9986 RepID=UPI003879A793
MPLAVYACLLWLCTSGHWAVQAADPPGDDICTRSPHRGLAPANVDFAFSLYRQLVSSAPDRNICISPVSVSMALAMLSLGASGHTRTQLLQGLGFNLTEMPEAEIHQGFQYLHHLLGESDTSLEMTMGNALFLDHSLELLESFSADIRRYYESEALATDFQDWPRACRQINEYIENKTQGKIADLFLGLENPAILILVNYIFFKGTWAHPFDPESTEEKSFYVDDTTTVMVPMMFQSSTVKYLHDPVLPCRLVQLDYVGNGTAFFILPDKGKVDTVIAALSRDTIQRWSKSLTHRLVHLYIPKASISGAYELRGALAAMGIADLFTNQANFSSISQEGPLKVSKVLHKAVLQLDEHGGVEVAATGGPLQLVSEPLTLNFNRPFLILIFDDFTWSSLFLGKVVIPA